MNNFLIETVNRLSLAQTGDARWEVAKQIASDLGFNAINVVSADLKSGEYYWILSAMRQDWLQDYIDQRMFSVDPLIAQLRTREALKTIQGGTLSKQDAVSGLQFEYNQQLRLVGYESLFSFSVAGHRPNESRIVVFSGADKPADIEHTIGLQNMQFVASAIGTMMKAPEDIWGQETIYFDGQSLSPREVEVLSLLAMGHRNLVIADKLNISEMTVRMHISAARKKLSARTREQALVKAAARGLLSI